MKKPKNNGVFLQKKMNQNYNLLALVLQL